MFASRTLVVGTKAIPDWLVAEVRLAEMLGCRLTQHEKVSKVSTMFVETPTVWYRQGRQIRQSQSSPGSYQ